MAKHIEQEQANEALMRSLYDDVLNAGNVLRAAELVSDDFVEHIPRLFPVQPSTGPTALVWLATQIRAAFPDLQVTVEDVIASSDKAVARVSWRATHKGEVLGITPTNRPIHITGFDMVRVADGKIVEHWGQYDILTLIEQLGFLPELG